MPWLKIRFPVRDHETERVAQALEAAGAISVSIENAGDDTLFEAHWNEPGMWPQTWVTGLYPEGTDVTAILNTMREFGSTAPSPYTTEALEDREWERVWMDRYIPFQVGDNLWICPSWRSPPNSSATNIVLDPGLAFGTGTHPSTALCLAWLARHPLTDRMVIDYGCGSGILAITALKLGARAAFGIDNDARALDVSRTNAIRNGVADRYRAVAPSDVPESLSGELVLANILAQSLIGLAPELVRRTGPGGQLVLAGILRDQADEVHRHYAPTFTLRIEAREEWILLAGRKRAQRPELT